MDLGNIDFKLRYEYNQTSANGVKTISDQSSHFKIVWFLMLCEVSGSQPSMKTPPAMAFHICLDR